MPTEKELLLLRANALKSVIDNRKKKYENNQNLLKNNENSSKYCKDYRSKNDSSSNKSKSSNDYGSNRSKSSNDYGSNKSNKSRPSNVDEFGMRTDMKSAKNDEELIAYLIKN